MMNGMLAISEEEALSSLYSSPAYQLLHSPPSSSQVQRDSDILSSIDAEAEATSRRKMRRSDAPLYMLMLFILVLVVLTLSEIAMVKHSGGSVMVGRGGFHMSMTKVSICYSYCHYTICI